MCVNIDDNSIDPDDVAALAVHFRALATYAERKADAMRRRLAGDIKAALEYERTCDVIYRTLPDDFRW